MKLEKKVQVWVERAEDYSDTSNLESLLNDNEIERANQFISQQDRATFIVAHALKRKRIAEKLGSYNPSQLNFLADKTTGKPYLLDAGIHFNISHSHGMAALAISEVSECSVDIEVHRNINQLSLLIKTTMTEHEQNEIQASSSSLIAFLDRWVVKEAFLKLSGIGLAEPLSSICVESELTGFKTDYGMLRGNTLFFKRGQDYSLAASSNAAIGFSLERSSDGSLEAV